VNRDGPWDLTARRAALVISAVTLAVTVAGGMLMTIADRDDFPTLARGMWWAVQTVTTVGYGDVTPKTSAGKLIATVVMITGIGFLTVVTAAITATFIESARRRRGMAHDQQLREIADRLERIERRLGD
jgi:voltage-gated potassium channel